MFSWKVISCCLQLGDHSHAAHEIRRASLLTSFRKVVALRIFFNYFFENTINKCIYPDDIDQLTKLNIEAQSCILIFVIFFYLKIKSKLLFCQSYIFLQDLSSFAIFFAVIVGTAVSKPLWSTLVSTNYLYSTSGISAQPQYFAANQNTHSPYYVYNVRYRKIFGNYTWTSSVMLYIFLGVLERGRHTEYSSC